MEEQEVGAVSYAFTQETGLKLACAAEDSKADFHLTAHR